ncbi:hypothetical protein [Marinobacter changyiensis]|uniref:hypothetical protein n=1 Tax=Marinobacter changyiensis TaxID=2604091 RepID=UPI00126560ED|nr:hypothetical protein [Marinobacter changyiensis]
MLTIIKAIITIATFCLCFGGSAYAKQDTEKQLPSGLQKKVQSGESLPPGWQKKLAVGEVLDDEVYKLGHVIKTDSDKAVVTISVEGKLIRIMENTREVVEILEGL